MRRKCIGTLFFILFITQIIHSQTHKDSIWDDELTSLIKLKISDQSGIEYERKIFKTTALNVGAGAYLGMPTDGFSLSDYKGKWGVVPDLFIEVRNYYNVHQRNFLKKNTLNNSANFLFARVEVFFAIKNQNYFNLLTIQGWGLQRCISKKITIDGHLGIIEHFYFDKPPKGGFNYILFEPFANFSFNFLLFNKKMKL